MNSLDRPILIGLSTHAIPGACPQERSDLTSAREQQACHFFGGSRCIRMMLAPGTLL
jgi:hypothetical protein